MRAAIFSLLLLAGCATSQPMAIHLAGTQWVMVFPEEHAPDAAAPTIIFESTRASGFGGCNRWFASVTQDGEALRFGEVGATRMACAAGAMNVERAFFSDLSNTRYAHFDRDALVLLDERQQILARFARVD